MTIQIVEVPWDQFLDMIEPGHSVHHATDNVPDDPSEIIINITDKLATMRRNINKRAVIVEAAERMDEGTRHSLREFLVKKQAAHKLMLQAAYSFHPARGLGKDEGLLLEVLHEFDELS